VVKATAVGNAPRYATQATLDPGASPSSRASEGAAGEHAAAATTQHRKVVWSAETRRRTTAGQQSAREPFAEQGAGKEGDQDRPDVDEHRGGAGVDSPLARVQGDVVGGEPEEAAETDQRQVARARERLPPCEDEQPEDQAADEEPAERERRGREVVACGSDPDERRRPQHEGDRHGAGGEPVHAPRGRNVGPRRSLRSYRRRTSRGDAISTMTTFDPRIFVRPT
jgi:hypothetical protein